MSRALPAGCAMPASPSTCPPCSAATARCPMAEEGVGHLPARLHERRIPRHGRQRLEPGDAMAARAGAAGARRMRRPRRRRHRHVLHRQFRAHHDAGAGDAGAGAVAAVAAAATSPRASRSRRTNSPRCASGSIARTSPCSPIASRATRSAAPNVLPPMPPRSAIASSAANCRMRAANTDVSPFFARHVPFPHSVVTQHLIDQAGQPTIAARDEILGVLQDAPRACRRAA